jgi:DNA polymerase-3 subunit gamma/tau
MTCENCKEFGDGKQFGFLDFELLECGERSGVDAVNQLVETARYSPFSGRRVFMLDEVHNLSPRAFEPLHSILEVRKPWVQTFILATTRLDKIPLPIQSRVKCFELHVLGPDESVRLLKTICAKEKYVVEDNALDLLASASQGKPRVLVRNLELVACPDHRITAGAVRKALNLDFADHLSSFARAFIAQDLQGQLQAVDQWRIEAPRKLDFIHRFLAHVYVNDVLRYEHADPLVDVLPPQDRVLVAQAMAERSNHAGVSLDAFWQDALEQLGARADVSDTDLRLRLAKFHRLVVGTSGATKRDAVTVKLPLAVRRNPTRLRAHGAPIADRPYLTQRQACAFYEIGSFMTQQYGVLYNARVTLIHRDLVIQDPSCAAGLTSELSHEIRGKLNYRLRPKRAVFHFCYTHEMCRRGLTSRLAMHIPKEYISEILSWVQTDFLATRNLTNRSHGLLASSSQFRSTARALDFHWTCVKAQMRGLDPSIFARSSTGVMAPLVELLAIPRRLRGPSAGACCGQSFGRSESLGPTARQQAEADNFEFLSAFRDGAWDHLYIGWQLDEFAARQREIKKREQEEAKLRTLFDANSDLSRARLTQSLAELRSSWPCDPRERRRPWRGWWR